MRPFLFIPKRLSTWTALPLLLSVSWTASAQQTPVLDKRSVAIKRKADSLTPQAKISIVYRQSGEAYGQFLSDDAESFTFYDIDSKTNVTARFADIKKIKDGYGGYNSVTGRHTDHAKGLLIAGAVVTVLIVVILAAAKS